MTPVGGVCPTRFPVADTLWNLGHGGYIATRKPGGSRKPRSSRWRYELGCNRVLWPGMNISQLQAATRQLQAAPRQLQAATRFFLTSNLGLNGARFHNAIP